MVYFFLAVALAIAFTNYVKIIELEERIKKIENKIKWWL
jgi:hypothetical protein